MDQGSNKNHSPAYNFTPTVTKFCVTWEGLSLPHDTKFGNCRCKIVDSRSFHSWSLIHGLRWSGLIKVGPASWYSSKNLWLRDEIRIWPMSQNNGRFGKPALFEALPVDVVIMRTRYLKSVQQTVTVHKPWIIFVHRACRWHWSRLSNIIERLRRLAGKCKFNSIFYWHLMGLCMKTDIKPTNPSIHNDNYNIN